MKYKIHVNLNTHVYNETFACGLGDPSDGLHDPSLERTNWNTDRLTAKGLKP